MAWTVVPIVVAGQMIDATWMNTYLRDNMQQQEAYLAAAKGDIFAATGANALARVAAGTDGYAVEADSAQSAGVGFQDLTSHSH